MITFLVSAIRLGMTLLFGSTGETITEKSGHLNLGIPGVMCVGAACGCVAESIYYNAVNGKLNPILAVIIPIIATFLGGALMGLIYSFLTVTLRANQNVTGLVLTTFGVGVSDYMISQVKAFSYSKASKYFIAHLPFADDLGWFGKLFFSYGIMIYLAIAVALGTSFVLNRTRLGLHLRAVGENPATADAAGINVSAYRYGATCIGCGIAGLGGMYYVMDYTKGTWAHDGTIETLGWLAVALVIFTTWKSKNAIWGSYLFGVLYWMYLYIPGLSRNTQPLFKMLPYVVTIIVLVAISIRKKRENQPPASLGLPYFREER